MLRGQIVQTQNLDKIRKKYVYEFSVNKKCKERTMKLQNVNGILFQAYLFFFVFFPVQFVFSSKNGLLGQ